MGNVGQPKGLSVAGAPAYYPGESGKFAADKKIATGLRFDTVPTIDGRFDDACWQKCKAHGEFTLVSEEENADPAGQKTSFRIGYDQTNLYFAIRCDEASMPGLVVSAQPAPEKRDSSIENQDVVHVLLAPPQQRNGKFWHLCVNAAGEIVDTLMSWEPGHVGWFHRGFTMDGVKAGTSRDATGWNVELLIPYENMWSWGAGPLKDAWGMQLVRAERPSAELSAWNRFSVFPQGPDHFGILFLDEQKPPLYVEHVGLIHLNGDEYLVRTVVRKLVPEKVDCVLSINGGLDFKKQIAFERKISTVFLPFRVEKAKLQYKMDYGRMMSLPVAYNVLGDFGDGPPRILMYAEKRFPEHSVSPGLIMPGVNDKTVVKDEDDREGLRLLTPETNVILAGQRSLRVKFDLPVGDDLLNRVRLVIALKDQDGQLLREQGFVLTGRQGVFALATQQLSTGTYSVSVIVEDNGEEPVLETGFDLGVMENKFYHSSQLQKLQRDEWR